jgi:hypothetical protein
MEDVVLLYASNRRLKGWGSLDVGGPVELFIWRSVSPLETAPMWVSPTQGGAMNRGLLFAGPPLKPIGGGGGYERKD